MATTDRIITDAEINDICDAVTRNVLAEMRAREASAVVVSQPGCMCGAALLEDGEQHDCTLNIVE